jgi:hypothetical protein
MLYAMARSSARTVTLATRITPAELDELKAIAVAEGMPLGQWVRTKCGLKKPACKIGRPRGRNVKRYATPAARKAGRSRMTQIPMFGASKPASVEEAQAPSTSSSSTSPASSRAEPLDSTGS